MYKVMFKIWKGFVSLEIYIQFFSISDLNLTHI